MLVVALGLCSPLALDRRGTQREVGSGADMFTETEHLGPRGQPLRASRLELVPASATRSERMAALATRAFAEIGAVAQSLGLTQLPTMLALPEVDGGASWRPEPIWQAIGSAAQAFGIHVDPLVDAAARDASRRTGAAGVFQLLTIAEAKLDAGVDPLIIGAIDSRCDPTSLIELARARRLIDGGREGYMPGEGAGFVLLSRNRGLLPPPAQPFSIVAHTHDQEARSFAQREPSQAIGLTRAFKRVRESPGVRGRTDLALSCQSDAPYWGRELVSAYLRNAELLPEPLRVDSIAETLGNPGAAGPLLQLGRALDFGATTAWANQRPASILLYGCAEAGALGACVVEAAPDSALLERLPPVLAPEDRAFELDRLADHAELIGSLLVERFDDLRGSIRPWPELVDVEHRLHARVEAALEHVQRFGAEPASAERPGPEALLDHDDPEIARGCAFVLLAHGTPAQAERALDHARARCEAALPDAPEELTLWRSCLELSRHGRDPGCLPALVTHDFDPAIVELGIDVLDALEHRPPELALALLARPEQDPAVQRRALNWLMHSSDPRAAAEIEAAWRRTPLDPEGIERMLNIAHREALEQLRFEFGRGVELPAAVYEVWALGASLRDAPVFARLAAHDDLEPRHLWALSSFGSLTAAPTLLAALEQPHLALDAAIGLERLLGPGLIAPTWIPDADADDPEQDGEMRLTPVLDPGPWREVVARWAPRIREGGRVRLGRTLNSQARLAELAAPNSLLSMRERAVRELSASLGSPLYFGFDWPIAAQHFAIARLRSWLEGA
ncbi:hypothetical protein G6O69_24760 [Pseudenhygromyxa sp. WMMC2535]|uniref:hypothetical protein n=1 Tax=Pseudenhygromyxa sp. WMMC2535 TaxID=2712867 RepID=UPI00155168B1|nr:hypothetical protein [Pseudenhygromyxa sp. WMMC2535]NVB41074.1 hypothetical protein [Pseudenhygromyxa sp. WMMC2535]